MRAAHARDDAEAAGMIAPLGNLHVSQVARGEPDTRRFVVRDVGGTRIHLHQRLFLLIAG